MNNYVIIFLGFIFLGAAAVFLVSQKLIYFALFMILAFCIFAADYLKIGREGIEFKRRVDSLDKSVKTLNETISNIYDSFILEKISISDLNSRFLVTKSGESSYIYVFKLRYTPILNSIDLLWGPAYQPMDTYVVVNNLLIFSSKEGLETFENDLFNRFIIRYFKNIKQGKTLELNDLVIKDRQYLIKSVNRTFKTEDFIQQSVIFE